MQQIHRRRIAFLLVFACLSIPGCNLPGPVTEVRYPYCMVADDLTSPNLLSPIRREVTDDLTPELRWSYPFCRPLNNQIEITESRGCWDTWVVDEGRLFLSETIGTDTTWSPETELEPLTLYMWRVAGIIHDVMGEYSDPGCFWTGPICDPDSLAAPEQAGPEDIAVITREFVVLSWRYPESCMPHNFRAELSADPSFTGENMMDDSGVSRNRPAFSQVSMATLENCTEYYWRVSARVGSVWGPYSPVWTFTTDFHGTCGGGGATPGPTSTRTPIPMLTLEASSTPHPTNTPAAPTPSDQDPPPAPSAKSPSGGLSCIQQVPLIWNPVNDPSGISEYRVVLEGHGGDNQWQTVLTKNGLQSTSIDVPVQCGWYYRWSVQAVDGAGNVGPSSGWIEFKVASQ
jgi:hypothetical protein